MAVYPIVLLLWTASEGHQARDAKGDSVGPPSKALAGDLPSVTPLGAPWKSPLTARCLVVLLSAATLSLLLLGHSQQRPTILSSPRRLLESERSIDSVVPLDGLDRRGRGGDYALRNASDSELDAFHLPRMALGDTLFPQAKHDVGKKHVGEPKGMLAQWLYQLVLNIPEDVIKKGPYTVKIRGGMCRHMQLAGIDLLPASSLFIHPKAKGLSAECTLGYKVTGPLVDIVGDVDAGVQDSSIDGPLEFASDAGNPPLPIAVHAQSCTAQFVIGELHFRGGAVSSILDLLAPIIKTFLNDNLQTLICTAIDKAVNIEGSAALNNASKKLRTTLEVPVEPVVPPAVDIPAADLANFSANPGMQLVQKVLKVLDNPDSDYNFKALANRFLGSSGVLSVMTHPASKVLPVANMGTVNITFERLELHGLNSTDSFTVAAPQAQEMTASLAAEELAVNMTVHLEVTPSAEGPLEGDTLVESFSVMLGTKGIAAGGAIFAAIQLSQQSKLTADQLTCVGCLLPSAAALLDVKNYLEVGGISLLVQPRFGNMDALAHDVDALINAAVQLLLGQFPVTLPVVLNHTIAGTVRDSTNAVIQRKLQSGMPCKAPDPTYTSELFSDTMLATCLALTFAACMICIVLHRCRSRRRSREAEVVESLPEAKEAPDAVPANDANPSQVADDSPFAEQQCAVVASSAIESSARNALFDDVSIDENSAQTVGTWDCLATHPRIPLYVSIAVPLLLVATIMLFVSSNSDIGVSIIFTLLADGELVVDLPPVKEFSLVSSVVEMSHARAIVLATLIILFSGVWPYLKLMLMLWSWFAPSRVLPVRARQKLLYMIDALGKWSLVDCFVMVLFMVAFRFDITPSESDLAKNILDEADADASATIWVRANLAMQTYLAGTMASLILGHGISGCSRYAIKVGEYGGVEDACTERQRLCNVLQPESPTAVFMPIIALVGSAILLMVGVFQEAFQFEFQGMAGWILGDVARIRPYSVLDLAAAVSSSTPQVTLAVRWLQSMFIVYVLLVPFAYPVCLLVLWTAKLTNRVQRQLLVGCEVLAAWSALDVFVLSIAASVLEIERFAVFIVGDKCDAIDRLLSKTPIADQVPGPMTCFDVKSTLRPGYFILLAASLLSSVMGSIVLFRCTTALRAPSQGTR